MEQNVGSLQDILFYFKRHTIRVENLEQQIIELKLENKKLANQWIETRSEFEIYGQTLVNEGIIAFGLEPYLCELCNAIESGNFMNTVKITSTTSFKDCTLIPSTATVCACDGCCKRYGADIIILE